MKKVFIAFTFVAANLAFAQSVLLKGDMDPREIMLPSGYRLWSDAQAEKEQNRPMREEVMLSSTLYLENRISNQDFVQLLKSWSESGFNHQERIVLTDTLQKSNLPQAQKSSWLCRLDSERNCSKIKIFPKHLAPILQKYDFLVLDGQVFPRLSWDEITIPDEAMTWVFYSARFETYIFKGKWEELKYKNPALQDWVTGNCENFNVRHDIQNLDTQVMLNRNCIKNSMAKPKEDPSFYEKNKSKIWIAAGLVLGVGAFNTFTGNKIVLEKPAFR